MNCYIEADGIGAEADGFDASDVYMYSFGLFCCYGVIV